MSDAHSTPIGTPVVLAPGRIVLMGEYAALTDGSTIEAAFGCYAKAQFIPQRESAFTMTLLAAIVDRIKIELADLAPALPPGTVLVTNEDFRTLGSPVAGIGGSAAMAVAAVGAVLESLGLALESRKPMVFRIADAARRQAQGYLGAGSDTAVATYGGLIRTGRSSDGQRLPSPLVPPTGLHLVAFTAGPSRSPAEVAQGLHRYARADAVAFLEAVARLREISVRFLDEVASGQATAAISAVGKYGEVLQALCGEAEVPIMNEAFTRAAALARELGGIAKPTGAGNGEIGVALFATPEARTHFRKACTEPLVALEGDLDGAGVRCEFPDNAIVADLDERDSAELPEAEPDEFDMPTVKTGSPIFEEAHPASAARNSVSDELTALEVEASAAASTGAEPVFEEPARRSRWPVIVIIALGLGLALGFEIHRRLQVPGRPSSTSPAGSGLPNSEPSAAPTVPVKAAPVEPMQTETRTAAPTETRTEPQEEARPTEAEPLVEEATGVKPKRGSRALRRSSVRPRAGRLSPADF